MGYIIHKEVMSSFDTEYTLHSLSNPQAIPSEKQRFKNKRKINRKREFTSAILIKVPNTNYAHREKEDLRGVGSERNSG